MISLTTSAASYSMADSVPVAPTLPIYQTLATLGTILYHSLHCNMDLLIDT